MVFSSVQFFTLVTAPKLPRSSPRIAGSPRGFFSSLCRRAHKAVRQRTSSLTYSLHRPPHWGRPRPQRRCQRAGACRLQVRPPGAAGSTPASRGARRSSTDSLRSRRPLWARAGAGRRSHRRALVKRRRHVEGRDRRRELVCSKSAARGAPVLGGELAPRYWRITRARLDRAELDREVGWLTVPELPLPSAALAAPPAPVPWAPTEYYRRCQRRGSRSAYHRSARRDLKDVAVRIEAVAEHEVLVAMDLPHPDASGDEHRTRRIDVVDVKHTLIEESSRSPVSSAAT